MSSPLDRVGGRRALFLIVSPAAAGSDLGVCLPSVFNSLNDPQGGSGVNTGNPRAMILIGPTLATNVLSTSLIGIQLWWVVNFSTRPILFFSSKREHRRKRHVLFSHLSGSSVAIRAEKILAMLVESGFAYCCIWVRHRSLSFFPRLFRN